jgi:hypothetical protein
MLGFLFSPLGLSVLNATAVIGAFIVGRMSKDW